MSRDLQERIEGAIEDLNDWAKDNPDATEPHDMIHEIADGAVPVYNSDLLKIASEDNAVALDEPEIGPAFDGTPTPINIIAANVFERIEAALWDRWREIEQERKDAEDAADEAGESEAAS